MQQLNLGIIGGGTVGGGVYYALERNGSLMASRLGLKLNVLQVAVRHLEKARPVTIPEKVLTTDWQGVVDNPQVHIVLEMVGGTTFARSLVLRALKRGKPVVTANKALLSAHGEELFEVAESNQTNLYYEASVGGGIPIIKVLREGLVGNRITHLYGITNGTSNYILTQMREEGIDFEGALSEAQRMGYAEADPSLDVDGGDAMHKIGILASLAHGFWVNPKDIFLEGIRSVSPLDIQFAERMGYAIKLLGVVKQVAAADQKGGEQKPAVVQISVAPTLIPDSHVLASVNGVYNAIYVRGDMVGDTLYYGQGAGQDATASAVLSDVADAALDQKWGTQNRLPPFVPHERDGSVLPKYEMASRYYIRLHVIDRPGTLSKIAAILGEGNIGISSVIQPEANEGEVVPLMLMIHEASHATIENALSKIAHLDVVKAPPVTMRVENFE